MAVTVNLYLSVQIVDNDADDDTTSPTYVVEKAITGLTTAEKKRIVVNNTTKTLYSSTGVGEAAADFDLLVVWSDVEVELELTCNDGDAAEAIHTVKLVPNVPYVLGSDDGRYNTGALTGSADVYDLIRVKNSNATDAIVHFVVGT